MAAVDLEDLVDSLRRTVSPPGIDLFPLATDDDWVGRLQDGFWAATLDGFFLGAYTESNGLITPVNPGSPDMGRDLQQLIVFYASFRIVLSAIRNFTSLTRSKAGPVEFETTSSPNLMRDLLKELAEERNILLRRLSDIGTVPSYYVDGVAARTDSIVNGITQWTRGSSWAGVRGVPSEW